MNIDILLSKLKDVCYDDIEVDDLLDSRDEETFDSEWISTYNDVENMKRRYGYDEQQENECSSVRETAFMIVCEACGGELAGYVSDDFGLIFDSQICGFENEFLKKLINAYSQAIIPDGSIL